MTGPETFFGIKIATLLTAAAGAVISVLLELRTHDLLTATGSILAGVFIAIVATDPTIDALRQYEHLSVSESWGYAIAAAYGITGRNLIIFLKRSSKDPIATVKAVWPWGKK
ncbi:hypothetical protein [Maritalea porphyrae]|uniref:hypothetical protein n=1 Tax=Maritalea porphyrae TaxID=880732 RepID=UPI0022B049A5|nr:hypothetical protein [Maritalea porphyrae]MCZ4273317.1 hypothetical protein [Maritalea porphyrae]